MLNFLFHEGIDKIDIYRNNHETPDIFCLMQVFDSSNIFSMYEFHNYIPTNDHY